MPRTVPPPAPPNQPVFPDIERRAMAKADVRVPDIDWMKCLGVAIQDAVHEARWSHKEAAGIVVVDDAEFGKWLSGGRRPHFDKLFAVKALRWPLIVALAEHSGEADRIVTLRKRSA